MALMARPDLPLGLVQAGIQEDRGLFHRTVDAIIASGRGKQHHVLAPQLEDTLRTNGKPDARPVGLRKILGEIVFYSLFHSHHENQN